MKSLLLAFGMALSCATLADAREHRAAPIEYARVSERPADASSARPAATAPVVGRRAAPAALDLPEMLYGYGRAAARSEPAVIDLRGRLNGGPVGALLEDAAFDESPAVAAQSFDTAGEAFTAVAVVSTPPVDVIGAPPAAASAPVRDGYFVQVGAFTDPANAARVRATLDDVGPVTVDLRETATTTLHRVRLGQWATRQEAERALDTVAARGFAGALVAGGP